jgi:hypothetical protein
MLCSGLQRNKEESISCRSSQMLKEHFVCLFMVLEIKPRVLYMLGKGFTPSLRGRSSGVRQMAPDENLDPQGGQEHFRNGQCVIIQDTIFQHFKKLVEC